MVEPVAPEPLSFGHFQLVTHEDGSPVELGRGSMGVTYKALDTNLQCLVALKVINADLLHNEAVRERFLHEARSAAQLRHPHVASVFHLGVESSQYFYAMEFIDGENVESYVSREGPLEPTLALNLTLQVCRALAAANKQQLVHRDIKPANLMLVLEDGALIAKVIDFGLAQAANEVEQRGLVGTPFYASPEQIQQTGADIRSDIYSLGATLWFMLTGEPPFTGDASEVMRRKVEQPPPFECLANFPTGVIEILQKMLAIRAVDRPQSPASLRAELERCLSALGETSGPQLPVQKTAQPVTVEHAMPAPGEVLAGRYRILKDLGERSAGRVFQAECLTSGSTVCLNILRHRGSVTEQTAFEREVERLQPIEHPNLLRIFSWERWPEFDILTAEWVTGFSLFDLLRVRRRLGLDEILVIIEPIAVAIEFGLQHDFERLLIGLRQILVHFPGGMSEDERRRLMIAPVDQWPPFELKVYPLGVARGIDGAATWMGDQTTPGAPAVQDLSTKYLVSLGSLVYELLGGTAPARAARYVPLPQLSEEGNRVLKRCLAPIPAQSTSSSREFVRALAATAEGEARTQKIVSFESPAAVVPAPQHSNPATLVWGGIAALVLVTVTATIFLKRQEPPPLIAMDMPPPAKSADQTATIPTGSPPPTIPQPLPSREEQFAAALMKADEQQKDAVEYIAALVKLARDYPERVAVREKLEAALPLLLAEKPQRLQSQRSREALTAVAKLGLTPAMVLLAGQLRPTDPAASLAWFEAAATRGDTSAMIEAGLMRATNIADGQDLKVAVAWFESAAERGDPKALYLAGECYYRGKGVPADPKKAVELLTRAAALDELRATDLLGSCYRKGVGVPVDYVEAARLFERARSLGNLNALGNLGVLFMNGEGVPKDPQKAAGLFREGAHAGNDLCMYFYGMSLEGGVGVKRDLSAAKTWYKAAARAGNRLAIDWCRKNGVAFDRQAE